jgi:hypothetical protein
VPELRVRRGSVGEGRPEPPQALGQASEYVFGGVGRAAKNAHRPTLWRNVAVGTVAVENNLNIANMDWQEFAAAVDEDGVFRGPDD